MHKAKLCLGTVQLGIKYGVNNVIGRQPTKEEAFALLSAAQRAGVDTFDTASAYGTAEDILGNFFQNASSKARFISKLKPDCEKTKNAVLTEIKTSLLRLKVSCLEGYLLHRATDLQCKDIMEGLAEAKKLGLTSMTGISIYKPEEALSAVTNPCIDCIQIPYNVLDKRLDQTGFFKLAKENCKIVYARSAFLQGLLLMEPEKAEFQVNGSGKFIKLFHQIAEKYGYTPVEAAFLYCINHPGIDYVVFGVDTIKQLAANITIYNKADNFNACYEELFNSFKTVPKKVIMPNLW